MNVFAFQSGLAGIFTLVLLVATLVAIVDAITRRAEVFEAAGKLTKNGWLLILVICAGMQIFLGGIGLFIGAIATLVYFLDVRPAVAALTRRR
ncbi:MAG: hypothetical protein JWO46_2089 [Nocardioidaceae bacterium]|nr:hypothetical protein [Nocardioidaceae bacterium]